MSTTRLIATLPTTGHTILEFDTTYLGVAGGMGQDTASGSNRGFRIRTPGQLSMFSVNKLAGDRATMAAALQISLTDATLNLAFSSVNGIYEDTANRDVIDAGSFVNWRFYGGATGTTNLVVSVVACNFTTPSTTATNVLAIGPVTVSNPTVSGDYRPLNGYARDGAPTFNQAAAQWQVEIPSGSGPLTIKNLYVRAIGNSCTAGVIITVNGASGTGTAPTVTVPAGVTAEWEDTTHQITALDGDLLCLKFVVDPISSGPSPYAGFIDLPVIKVEIDGPNGLFHFVHNISDGVGTVTINEATAIGGGREFDTEANNQIGMGGLALNCFSLAINYSSADATGVIRLRRSRAPVNTSLVAANSSATGWITRDATENLQPTDLISLRATGMTTGVTYYTAAVTVLPEPVPGGIREPLRYIRSPGQSPGPPALSHLRSKRQFLLDRTVQAAAATTDADGASVGTSTVQATSTRILAGTGASAGIGTVAAQSQVVAGSNGASAGVGTPTGTGASIVLTTASSVGASVPQAVGATVLARIAATAGTSTVQAISGKLAGADASTAGISTVQASSTRVLGGVASSVGVGTVLATSGATSGSVGASAGLASLAGASTTIVARGTSAAGIGTPQAAGASLTTSTAATAGTSTVAANSLALSGSLGSVVGTATVQSTGANVFAGLAASAGTSTVGGESSAAGPTEATGTSQGTCQVAATSSSLALAAGGVVGVATVSASSATVRGGGAVSAGASTAASLTAIVAASAMSSIGVAVALSSAASLGAGIAISAGTSTAVSLSEFGGPAEVDARAAGIATALAVSVAIVGARGHYYGDATVLGVGADAAIPEALEAGGIIAPRVRVVARARVRAAPARVHIVARVRRARIAAAASLQADFALVRGQGTSRVSGIGHVEATPAELGGDGLAAAPGEWHVVVEY